MKKGFYMGLGSKTIVIVDDVYTTGTTMNQCASVLKKNGTQKVFGLTLACG